MCGGSGPDCTGAATNYCCGTSCVDLTQNPNNCGSCGFQCNANAYCFGSTCQCDTSTTPWANCNGSWGDGCEVDTSTNVNHCGGCTQACDMPHVNAHDCVNSICLINSCDAGYYNLDGDLDDPDGCECGTVDSESTGNACAEAVDVGIIYDTGDIGARTAVMTGNLAYVGDVDWYQVDARDNADTSTCATGKVGETFDLRVAICPANGEFQVDVFKGACASTAICSDDAVGLTYDFSGTYTNPGDAGGGLCHCTSPETATARICNTFASAPWGSPAAIYFVRVERTGTGTTCGSYTLKFANNPGSASDYTCP